MHKDSQLRCFMKNLDQIHQNITTLLIDDDLRDYSTVVSLVVTVLVFMSNTMLIYGMYKTNKQLSLTKQFFIYLSITDIATTCFGIITTNMTSYIENMPCVVTLTMASIRNGLNCLAFWMFFNISLLRYLSIIRPFLQIRNKMRTSVLFAEILCVCLIIIAYSVGIYNLTIEGIGIFQFTIVTIFFIGIAAILVLNMLSYIAMRSTTKKPIYKNARIGKTKTYQVHQATNVSSTIGNRQKKAAVVTLIIITVCYLVCNLPILSYTLLSGLLALKYQKLKTNTGGVHPIQLIDLLYHIQLTNGGLNATIYILRCKQIKAFYKMEIVNIWERWVVRVA